MAEFQMILYQYVTTGIGALVTIFNSLMIVYIRYANIYKSNPIGYVYITNMAVTDLLVGLTMISLKSMHPHIDTKFTGPPFAQELYHILRFCLLRFSLLTSVLNLIALTLDRLFVIRFPFLVALRNKRFHVKICIWIWIVSFVITSAFYAITRFHLQNMEKYKDTLFPIATFPATVLFVMSYGYIFSVVSSSSNAINQKNLSLKQNQTKQSSTQKEKVAFIRLAVKTVVAFLIYWLPISITTITKSFDVNVNASLEATFFTFAFSNSLINPFIYFTHMRKAIATALGCIKMTSLTRFTLRGEITRENRYNENYDDRKVPKDGTFVSAPTVQQSKVEVQTPICFIGGRPLENHEMVVSNKETSVHFQLPKTKFNAFKNEIQS